MNLLKPISRIALAACLIAAAPQNMQAQDITGTYRAGDRDPQGTPKLFVLPQGHFAVIFHGGAFGGRWVAQGSTVTFTPYLPTQQFLVYGRHNKAVGDSTRIFFSGFDDNAAYMAIYGQKSMGNKKLRLVMNEDANCVPYPVLYRFPGQTDSLLFSGASRMIFPVKDNAYQLPVYSFTNSEKFNDFIVDNLSELEERRPFTATISKDGLAINGREPAERMPLELKKEDSAFIYGIAGTDFSIPEQVFYNAWHNATAQDIAADTLNYHYNAAKNAYISKWNYTEGEEFVKGDDGFNQMNIVYRFERLKPATTAIRRFTPDTTALMRFVCD